MNKRIFEQPDHPAYGAARRLWVVFQTLFADCYNGIAGEYVIEHGETWDETLARWIDDDYESASYNQRCVARRMLSLAR